MSGFLRLKIKGHVLPLAEQVPCSGPAARPGEHPYGAAAPLKPGREKNRGLLNKPEETGSAEWQSACSQNLSRETSCETDPPRTPRRHLLHPQVIPRVMKGMQVRLPCETVLGDKERGHFHPELPTSTRTACALHLPDFSGRPRAPQTRAALTSSVWRNRVLGGNSSITASTS